MGQKVHPYGFRLGIIRDTKSKWFAEGNTYRDQLVEDLQRGMISASPPRGHSDILIARAAARYNHHRECQARHHHRPRRRGRGSLRRPDLP